MQWLRRIFLGILLSPLGVAPLAAQEGDVLKPSAVLLPVKVDVSPPLRSIKPIPPRPGTWERPEHLLPEWINQPPLQA